MEAEQESRRVPLFGVHIDPLRMDELLERIDALVRARRRTQYVDINAAKAVMLRDDPRLVRIVRQCGLVAADGQAVVWTSRLVGRPLPERLAGIDVMARLFRLAEARGYSVYLLGATPEVLDRAERAIRRDCPRLRIAGAHHGYFGEEESDELARSIRTTGADLLVVGMPSPKKEYWLEEHLETTGAVFAMGVGGSFDVVAGALRRAPPWMRRAGLEWLFRLVQEPRRLWRRYLVGNLRFTLLAAREILAPRES
jgi:N-acetylglucosaminyldiphosphoundecaprenol N-acetyl-beta-D-mannosaminyltransferase